MSNLSGNQVLIAKALISFCQPGSRSRQSPKILDDIRDEIRNRATGLDASGQANVF